MSQATTSQRSRKRTVGDWVADHGLESWLLPLRTRKVDPLEIVRQVKTRLNELPDTQSTLTFKNLGFDQLAKQYKWGIMRLFLLRECEHLEKTRFLNPDYMHYSHTLEAITNAEKRLALVNMFRDSPLVTAEWLSHHFGTQPKSASNWLNDKGITLRPIRTENQARYGRTLWTLYQWGYGLMDLCRLLPVTTNTAKSWAIRYGSQAEDWEPPSRPTDEPWYNSHLKVSQRK